MSETNVDRDRRLSEAALVFLQHRAAIEHARTEAGEYLSDLWKVVPKLFLTASETGLRLPWTFRSAFVAKDEDKTTRGLDIWAKAKGDAPWLLPQPTIRFGDARTFPVPGTEVLLVVGAWMTANARAARKRHASAVAALRCELECIDGVQVYDPHDDWEMVRLGWHLGFRSLDSDAQLTAANGLSVALAFEQFLFNELAGL